MLPRFQIRFGLFAYYCAGCGQVTLHRTTSSGPVCTACESRLIARCALIILLLASALSGAGSQATKPGAVNWNSHKVAVSWCPGCSERPA